MASFPTLVREIPVYNLVPDEAVELIHEESMRILEEVGCEFRDDEAISMWTAAGADVRGTRVRIDRALLTKVLRIGLLAMRPTHVFIATNRTFGLT